VVTALGAISSAYFFSQAEFSRETALISLLFFVGIVLSDLFSAVIPAFRRQISASVALWVAGALVLGGVQGAAVATLATLVSELYLRWPLLRKRDPMGSHFLAFNVGQVALLMGLLVFFLEVIDAPQGGLVTPLDFGKAGASFVFAVLLNSLLVSSIVTLATSQPFRYLTREWFHDFSGQYLILGATTLLLVVLNSLSPWHMLLGVTPLVLVHLSFRSYLSLREVATRTFEKVVELLERRDPYTGYHSQEVAKLAGAIARELGLRGAEVEMIEAVARVHDIGKIAVPDRILLKEGKLDPEEWEVMKAHSQIGADLLDGLRVYGKYAKLVRWEHEHWDGTGYPDGLKGEEIPLPARIIAAADVWHALISDRPYRPAYSRDKALDIIRGMAGRELDPKIVGALLRVLERQQEEGGE